MPEPLINVTIITPEDATKLLEAGCVSIVETRLAHTVATEPYRLAVHAAQLAKDLAAARKIIVSAALETYTPDGSEVIANHLIVQQQGLRATAEDLAVEQERVAQITRVLNDDNQRDAEHSVAALGIHIPKVRDFFEAAWRALGQQTLTKPALVAADGHTVTVDGETTPHADLRLGPPDEFVQVQP